jgi:hypothetical protein
MPGGGGVRAGPLGLKCSARALLRGSPAAISQIPLAKRFQPLRSGRSCAKKQWETPLVSAQDVEV